MAEKKTPESGNLVVAALKYVFGPLAKKSDALPAPLAIGLPILVTVLLIAVLKNQLPPTIAWLVGLAIVVPMAGYIAQLVLGRGGTKVAIVPPWAEIESPKDGEPVDSTIECSGSATGIPENMHLWLAVEEDREGQKLIWPKEGEIIVNKQGKWKGRIFEDGVAQQFSVSLFMADTLGDEYIRRWLEMGRRTGYSTLTGIPGTTRITRVDRLRLKPGP